MIKSLYIHSLCLRRWLPYPALLSAVAAFSLGANVQAQEGEELEEVTVTGSRIVRRDYVSNSPIVTIEAEAFEQQTGLNIESYLNQLPEYNPAASPVTAANQDVQITPTNSVGIASISLRGFGPNRNLVLVDGHRPVPVNALMVTDINGIPSSLIQRAETITGGASAVYGADAVGGVTNFIVRKDYEGFEFDGQYGITEDGDGDENRISMLFGTNFADDRGNVTFSAERYERKAAMQIERDYYKDYWASPATPGYFFFNQGINGYSCSPACPTYGAMRSLFGGQNPGGWFWAADAFGPGSNPNTGAMSSGMNVSFNPDGTIFSTSAPIGLSRIDPATIDGLHYAYQTILNPLDSTNSTTAQGLKWNRLDGFASSPQDRYSFFASGNFDVTDTISIFARGRWAESVTETTLFGTDAISGWETNVPFNPATDSPITGMVYDAATYAAVAAAADPAAYLLANYANPNFIPHGAGTVKYCSAGVGGCPANGITDLANDRVGTSTAALVNTLVPYHPVPVEMAWLLNSRSNPSARWQPQWYPETGLPPRSTYNTIATWQMEGGVDFEIPFRDWSGEVYFSHGESDTYNVAGGNLSLARYRALANQQDWGAGTTGTGNTFYAVGQNAATATVVSTIRPTFGSGDFACTSGFYDTFFGGDQRLSKDCYDAVNAVLQTRTEMDQEIVEVNLQGGVYDLPAGELRMALGYQRRSTDGKFFPDILQSQDSFTDQVVGVYPTGYLDASTLVNDYYVEALVPVVKDLPYVQSFELELGARYSDYEGEGVADASYDPTLTGTTEWTYKILGSLEVKDWLRLRGGYNLATRAPNLGEMFLNPQEIFTGGGNFGDPCSVRANAPWGAGGTARYDDEVPTEPTAPVLASGQDQAGADRTADICTILMGATGAADYYNGIVGGVDSNRDFTQQGAGGGFAWVIQKGNPELRPEVAKTFTAGFVMNSPIENPWLSGITLAFDWYMVNIKNTIMTYSIDYANYRCFGAPTGLSAAEQAAAPACQLLPRDQVNGAALSTVLSYDNQATIETSGFDIAFNWGSEIADLGLINLPGRIGFNMQATLLDYYKTRQSPAPYDVEVEWKGSLGPNLSGTQGGAYDYRLFGSLSYSLNNWSASLRWRHLPGVYSAGYAEQQALIANNAEVTAGAPGLILTYTPTTEIETSAYDVFDLSANWSINEMFSLRAGITNLADKRPNFVAPSAGRPATEWDATELAAVCGGAPGCANPTTYSLPVVGTFNGGYYDTLGRRFFVGFKASY